MSEYSENYRLEAKATDDIRDKGLTTPEDIQRFDDILYGPDPKWHLLDVYRPKNAKDNKLPLIISVHGGGWVYGDKERYRYYTMLLSQHGFAVVNFTYRLAPDFKFPAPLEDLNRIAGWVLENAGKYGFDTDNIFAVGDSAGAQILGSYAAILTNPEFAGNFCFKVPENFRLKAVGLNCGVYKLSLRDADELTIHLLGDYLPEGGSDKELDLMCPVNHVTPDFPPSFVMTSLGDFLRDQAPLMNRKLDECGVRHVYRLYGSKENPLDHVFHCNMRLKEGHICNDEECAFFRYEMYQ